MHRPRGSRRRSGAPPAAGNYWCRDRARHRSPRPGRCRGPADAVQATARPTGTAPAGSGRARGRGLGCPRPRRSPCRNLPAALGRAPRSARPPAAIFQDRQKCNSVLTTRNLVEGGRVLYLNRDAPARLPPMDDRTSEAALALTKFGVGQPVRRTEDPKLLRGEGRYTDDIALPSQAYAVMVRANVAHGIIRAIDASGARAMPGVRAVLTGADLSGYGGLKCNLPLKNRDGSPIRYTPRPALASDKVRFVGDPVACVVADTIAQAKDAAEAVALDIEPLPAVMSAREAAQPGAPKVWDEVPDNIALDYHYGDSAKVAEAFAKAAHVVKRPLINQRLVVASIEPRAAIGEYDAKNEKWTLHSCSQGVFGLKNMLRDIFNAPADKMRVLTGNVGGSFGMKAAVYPEYVCI